MMHRKNRPWARLALALALAVPTFTAACGITDGDEEHSDAAEVRIFEGTTELARATATSATGSITVQRNQERHVRIEFYDASGRRVTLESDEEVRATVENPSIIDFESHGDHYDIVGKSAGTTTLRVGVWHLSHFDFNSRPITVTVP